MRTKFLCISVLRVASGPRVKLATCTNALTSPPPPLLLCGLFYEAICCMSFRVSFCSCVFQSF